MFEHVALDMQLGLHGGGEAARRLSIFRELRNLGRGGGGRRRGGGNGGRGRVRREGEEKQKGKSSLVMIS